MSQPIPSEDTPPSSPPPASPSQASSSDSFDFFDTSTDNDQGLLLSSHLERIHVTEGVRAGIAASKGVNVQAGFDEGYMLGAVLGLKCGEILGVLDGVVCALQAASGAQVARKSSATAAKSTDGVRTEIIIEQEDEQQQQQRQGALETAGVEKESEVTKESVELLSWKALQSRAKEELRLEVICGKAYFGQDGLWKWGLDGNAVSNIGAGNKWEKSTAATNKSQRQAQSGNDAGEDGDGDVTFYDVAAAHPLILKWAKIVSEEVRKLGIDLGSLNENIRS